MYGFRRESAKDRASGSAAKASTVSAARQSGDLYLRIQMTPHPRFERKGRDLYTHVAVPLTTAVLGGEAEVQTLSGKTLRLKIPPTTQIGQVFRLKGHGMPAVGKPDEHGDLYATVDVELPRSLTPEQRQHFEALQKMRESGKGVMNINKYTEKAREAVAAAVELAGELNHPQIEPEHLLAAMVEQKDGIVPELLRKMSVDPAAVSRETRALLTSQPSAYGGSQPGMSPRFKLVTDKAQAEADRLKDEFVSTEHLFLAIAAEAGRSPAAKLLAAQGVTADKICQRDEERPRIAAGDERESGRHVSGARAIRTRPDRARATRQAGSGDRPRRGDSPRHPGAVAANQEQPGPHRRARCRQDRDRRRAGQPHFPR